MLSHMIRGDYTGTSSHIVFRPYADWLDYVLSQKDADIPKSISTSYGDDEQTGK